jgi:hypothetical protein
MLVLHSLSDGGLVSKPYDLFNEPRFTIAKLENKVKEEKGFDLFAIIKA